MVNIYNNITFHLGLLLAGLLILMVSFSPPVLADDSAGCGGETRDTILGIPYWDRGITDCETFKVDAEGNGDEALNIDQNKVGTIITNIFAILVSLAGLVAVAFVIVGGFNYVLSTGSPDKANSAKSTIINALIGLVIAIMGRVISEIIYNSLTGG